MRKCFEGTKSKFRRQLERRDVVLPICTMWLRLSLQSSDYVWEPLKLCKKKLTKGSGFMFAKKKNTSRLSLGKRKT